MLYDKKMLYKEKIYDKNVMRQRHVRCCGFADHPISGRFCTLLHYVTIHLKNFGQIYKFVILFCFSLHLLYILLCTSIYIYYSFKNKNTTGIFRCASISCFQVVGIKFGLKILLRVKELTFRNSAFFCNTPLHYIWSII